MLVSPFTFFRGAALVMASDLSTTPRSGLTAQVCGDAHLSNFGVFGSPERSARVRLQRLRRDPARPLGVGRQASGRQLRGRRTCTAASPRASAGRRCIGTRSGATARRCAPMASHDQPRGLVLARRRRGGRRACSDAQAAATGSKAEAHMAATASKLAAKALTKDSMKAVDKLTTVVDGERVIVSEPPLIVPIEELFPGVGAARRWSTSSTSLVRKYRQSLPTDRRQLLEQYSFGQHRPQGGRRGQRGHPGLDHHDARATGRRRSSSCRRRRPRRRCSSASPRRAQYANHGARVVAGQRLMQASSDIFLGWQRVDGVDGVPARLLPPPAPGLEGFDRHGERHPRGDGGLRRALRPHAGPGPCPLRRPHRHRGVPRQQRHVRQGAGQLRRDLRRPERAGLRGLRPARAASGRLHAEEGL